MVRVPCGASWRTGRCFIALMLIWAILFVFSSNRFGGILIKTQKIKAISNNESLQRPRLITLPSQRKENSKIPDSFLEITPNISVHNYRYILQPVYDVTCGVQPSGTQRNQTVERLLHHNRHRMLALFLVHSKAGQFRFREAIRDTWGSEGQRLSRIVFLLGNPHNASCQSLVEEESKRFGDILQEDFYETYRNITLKAIMALKWASLYCPRARFVVKVDDDIFVGRKKILTNIVRNALPWRGLLLCKPTFHSPVLRGGKYAIAKELYSADQWPPFCFGGGWIASHDVIRSLYKMSLDTPQIHLDDVYVTGILRTKIKQKINRANVNGRLFCHSQGRPELIRKWWNLEKGNSGGTEAHEKWLDCFH